jgi:hypothetical protein
LGAAAFCGAVVFALLPMRLAGFDDPPDFVPAPRSIAYAFRLRSAGCFI